MEEVSFSISWDSYLSYVSKGFSYLQQNSEFVDMTLAADGHLVKVHQNIVALASPYLKAMLQSASCRHPVIFLNNVSYEILGYILEYIYTGEVKIPTNSIDTFVKACKSLYLKGIDTITSPKDRNKNKRDSKITEKPVNASVDRSTEKVAARITINTQDHDYSLEVIPNQNTNIPHHDENVYPVNCETILNQNSTSLNYHENMHSIKYEPIPSQNNMIINDNVDVMLPERNSSNKNIPTFDENMYPVNCEAIINQNSTSIHYENTHSINYEPNPSQNNLISNDNIDVMRLEHNSNTYKLHNDGNTYVDTESSQVDISSINNFVILKPEAYTDIQSNEINDDKQINLLSNIIIKESNLSDNDVMLGNIKMNVDNCQHLSQTISEKELLPHENTFNTNVFQKNTFQNSSDNQILLSTGANLNNIVLDAGHWHDNQQLNNMNEFLFNLKPARETLELNPGQGNLNSELEMIPTQGQIIDFMDLKGKKSTVKKKSKTVPTVKEKSLNTNLKKIAAFMKLKNPSLGKMSLNDINKIKMDKLPFYTISSKGSLQLMLDQFLFNSHHHSHNGQKRRWRCIDYRKLHCPAIIDTDNEEIKPTLTDHLHPNHDNIIQKKIKSGIMFTSLADALNCVNIKESVS